MTDKDALAKGDEDELKSNRDDELERRAEWLRTRFPASMRVIDAASVDERRAAISELYMKLDPLRGADRKDIDDTYGAGMSDMLESELGMADGGLFGDGGLTAGGIFGPEPIATTLTDPAGQQRGQVSRAHRALLGQGDDEAGARHPALAGPDRKLPPHRRERLLKGKSESDE